MPQPTSATQISLVPGRVAKRNGLRNPYARMRDALDDGAAALYIGLPATPAPVSGFTRRSAPLRTRGSPAGRRTLCARIAPPRPVGEVFATPLPPGGSPHGFFGVGLLARLPPNWPQSAFS